MNPYHLTPYFEGHKKTKKCAFKILLRCPNPKWQRNTCVCLCNICISTQNNEVSEVAGKEWIGLQRISSSLKYCVTQNTGFLF